MNVVHSPALDAANVVVRLDGPVEAGLSAAEIQPLDLPQSCEQFEVSIHGPETDPRQASADDLIKPGSGRMRCQLL
jgi:hypothetical protein